METQSIYGKLDKRVREYEELVLKRARQLCKEAGLDPNLLGIHPHNAMVSLHYGKPWPNVDYKKVRKVEWLINTQVWKARRLLETYCKRKESEMSREAYQDFMHKRGN